MDLNRGSKLLVDMDEVARDVHQEAGGARGRHPNLTPSDQALGSKEGGSLIPCSHGNDLGGNANREIG